MTLLLGALAIGLILALLGLGVFLSFRVLNFPDITADGSLTLGAALAALMIVSGWDPALATGAAFLAGCAAGALTGVIHTRLGVNGLLSGILVMTALYSVNLHIMGRSNISLLNARTGPVVFGQHWEGQELFIGGWRVPSSDFAVLAGLLAVTSMSAGLLFWFLRTQAGTALRASGDNPQMMRALGVEVHGQIILGLALANGLCAASGALLAQFQGFADVQMGIGMVVWGLASVIIGEALVGRAGIGTLIVGAVMGSVLFRLLVAIALRWGLDPNDLKLVTAVFVLLALMAPRWIRTRSLARTA